MKFSERIIEWQNLHGRNNLPWQTNDPYKVWVSEIMLQQTQVSTVIPFYENFMKSFPDILTLSKANLDEVLKNWAGLGFYRRARNLHQTAKIITDKYQFIIILFIILFSMSLILGNLEINSFDLIKQNSPKLLSKNYIPNYTAGLTFFIAVAATNLFHQGNWQRVYAAKNEKVLKNSLIISFLIIIPVVFIMGFSGLIAISQDSSVIPDLAFFSLLLKENTVFLSVIIVVIAISLTISSIDTLVNAISSLIVVDGKKINKNLKYPNSLVIFLSIIAFIIASKGFSIL